MKNSKALLECVNSISGENPQALEAKEEIKRINANPPFEVEHRTIILGFQKKITSKQLELKVKKRGREETI